MRSSSIRNFVTAVAFAALGFTGCAAENVSTHINALTGEECTPDATYMPRPHGNGHGGEQCQGTGPGDNCDDLHSGKIDCIGDGNSGQGDDRKHPCDFPQPGCDANGCCDGEIVEPPAPPEEEEPPTSEPTPTPEPEPTPEPTPEPQPPVG
jgi:hypothetical protein